MASRVKKGRRTKDKSVPTGAGRLSPVFTWANPAFCLTASGQPKDVSWTTFRCPLTFVQVRPGGRLELLIQSEASFGFACDRLCFVAMGTVGSKGAEAEPGSFGVGVAMLLA